MISPGTVKKRLGFLRTAINHAIDCDMHIGGNPAAGIPVGKLVKPQDPRVMPKKRPFKVDELNLIFGHPWFGGCLSSERSHEPGEVRLTGAHYWAPIVALFTGCRASELGGLRLSEIHLSGSIPHCDIRDNDYRRTKKGYARVVPLLDGLLELGFAEYVNALRNRGDDRLFPDWKSPKRTGDFKKDDAAWSNASVIRAFNRTVIQHRLGELLPCGARREVTFHSFRGAFKSMISRSRFGVNINVINDVMGHAKLKDDPRYVHVPIEESHEALHACRWDDLVLPEAPPLPI
jgi:integrase